MPQHSVYTVVTPLPAGINRETVREALHDHELMIDLNPYVIERHVCRPLPKASAEEAHATWYSITDKIAYLPGGIATKNTTYHACFHKLPNGLQTHIYAPLGLEIRGKWTVGGTLPGEPRVAPEMGIGAPKDGLYLREDVDMRCNFMVTKFVKKNLRTSHGKLVDRLIERSHLEEGKKYNERLTTAPTSPMASGFSPIIDSYVTNETSFHAPTPPNRSVSPSPTPSYNTSQTTHQHPQQHPQYVTVDNKPYRQNLQEPYRQNMPSQAPVIELDGQNRHIPVEAGGSQKTPVELP